jgi:hypothetical protein
MNLPDSVVRRLDSLKYGWFGWAAYPETIVILDDESQAAVGNARIRVNNVNGITTRVVNAPTNVNGKRLLYLDTASYQIIVTADGYEQKVDTITVTTTAKSDTIQLSQFNPGMPSSPDKCRVYIYTQDILGQRVAGAKFKASPVGGGNWVDSSGVIVIPNTMETAADTNGYAYLDLYMSSYVKNADGDSMKYNIEIWKQGYPRTYKLQSYVIPDSISHWLKKR